MPALTRRQLNRALLDRQLLLRPADLSPLGAVAHLAGMQAQLPDPPYIGLWARLARFERDDLTALMTGQQVVRAAMMRSTLHIVTAADHQAFRPALQPALERALRSFYGKRAQGLNVDALVRVARPFLDAAPRTTGELKAHLLASFPDADGDALAYAVRTYLPLVQVPPGGTWGSGSRASYSAAETALGPPPPPDLKGLLRRYLAAFGPASVMDFQFWTGLTSLTKTIQPWLGEFTLYEDENGKPLLDLPGAPLPDPATPAPPRFVPEYDNLVIAHKDRTRVLADADYKRVFLSAARVLPTILVDGFVAGTWGVARERDMATLTVTPFRPLVVADQDALAEAGERLLRFIHPDAATVQLVFAPPPG